MPLRGLKMDLSQLKYHTAPNKRAMVFIDGENLAIRYKELTSTKTPHKENSHLEDVYIWQTGFTEIIAQSHEIIRTTYYTSAVGDENRLAAIRDDLSKMTYSKHVSSMLPNYLQSMVFKRDKETKRSKGVDIALTVEALMQSYNKNVDSILLMTGDGDFLPLINEIKRMGIFVYLESFSLGLNQDLKRSADYYCCLDGMAFIS
jgi:uncharacterized LabA/DUF88 family protein